MKTVPVRWIEASDKAPYRPVKHSGKGEGVQLKGYDARNRVTTKKNGALVTSDFLKRDPSRIQQKKESGSFEGVRAPNQQKPAVPVVPKKWYKKPGISLTAPAVATKPTRAGMHTKWEKKTPNHSVEKLDYPKRKK
jgi:hypothetical protein